jgi:hypothetical protein
MLSVVFMIWQNVHEVRKYGKTALPAFRASVGRCPRVEGRAGGVYRAAGGGASMARGRSAGRRGGRLGSGPRCEWIGGRLSPPFFVDDRDEPYRAELVVWKEEPSGWLALHFERGADLPASMRREVAAHGWRVADANAYPRVERVDRDGARRPLVERDLRIAAACAASLSAFFVKHGDLFAVEEIAPVCESWFDGDDLEVRFTAPYQASHLFEVNDPGASSHASPESPARPKVGRNDPCPCGSGRKYKRCHLLRDEAERSAGAAAHPAHDLDQRLVRALSDFALARFGAAWQRFAEDFHDEESALQLSVPWSVFHYQVDGAPVFAWYLAEQGGRLSRAERAWLAAQGAAWLSVWEVTAVVPGESLGLRDLLSGETRCVREASASQTLVVRDALLGRVVDHEGVALLCGAHPRALPPFAAAEVVRSAKGRARRKASVPLVRLRDERFGRTLIRIWEETLAALDAERSAPPELCNTDGDPLLPTTDHFEIAPGARAAVEAALAALPGAEAGEEGGDLGVFAFLRPGSPPDPGFGDTLVGRARVSDTALRLETNSRERADALRARVEAACGERIRHRVREHADPLSSKAPRPAPGPAPEPPPDAQELLLAVKRRYYAEWPDQPLPALGGQTPRAAARTARGRDAVDVLLKEMENLEHRSAGGAVFDFSEIRRALGLE